MNQACAKNHVGKNKGHILYIADNETISIIYFTELSRAIIYFLSYIYFETLSGKTILGGVLLTK